MRKIGIIEHISADGVIQAPDREFTLMGTKTASSGVILGTYRPAGPLRTGPFDETPNMQGESI